MKHTLVIALGLFLAASIAYAVVPFKTSTIQMPVATDMGRCPVGVQATNCIDDNGEVPTWHYQDGGTASMVGGGGGGSGTVTSVTCGTGLTGGTITATGTCAIDSTVTTLTGSQTLTNKTLTAPTINGTVTMGSTPVFSSSGGLSSTIGDTFTIIDSKADGANTGLYFSSGVSWANSSAALLALANNFGNVLEVDVTGQLRAPVTVMMRSSAADGAGATAASIDTSTAWSNATASLLDIKTNNVLQFEFRPSGHIYGDSTNPFVQLDDSAGAKLGYSTTVFRASSGLYEWDVSGSTKLELASSALRPGSDLAIGSGTASRNWNGSFSAYYSMKIGAQLTAAATITPTTGKHHVTGATTIDTVAFTNFEASSNPRFCMVADSALITWSAAGNVAAAGTVAQNLAKCFEYDATATKWYPQD